MGKTQKPDRNYRELLVLSLVPGIVGALILASWALTAWIVGIGGGETAAWFR